MAAIQPLGRSVAPRVTVEFEVDGLGYRIEKRFVKRAMSELNRFSGHDWSVVADGEEADRKVRELVHGGERGRERVLPTEARGLAQALWLLQRDPGDLPKDWTPQVRQGLSGIMEDAAETPEAGRFGAALEKRYLEWFTPTGAEKKGGPLANTREAERQAEAELKALQDREEMVRGLRDRLDRQEDDARIVAHEAERHDLTVKQKVDAAVGADVHELAHAASLREKEEAEIASQALLETLAGLRERQEKASRLREELAEFERGVRHAETDAKEQNAARQEAQRQIDLLRGRIQSFRHRRDALDSALRRRTKLDQAEALEEALTEMAAFRTRIEEKQERLATLAAPDAKAKAAFDQADRDLATVLAVRQASGIVVRFALQAGAEVVGAFPPASIGEDGRYVLTRETTFDLGSLGSITVGGGGEGVAQLDGRIATHEAERVALLGDLSPEEFFRRHLVGEEIRDELRTETTSLAALERKYPRLESDLSTLRTEAADAFAHASTLDSGWDFLALPGLEMLRKAATEGLEGAESELNAAELRERVASQKATELMGRAGDAKNHLVRKQSGIDHEESEAEKTIQKYGSLDALLAAVESSVNRLNECGTKVEELEELHWARVDAPRQEAQQALDKQRELRSRAENASRTARDTRAALRQEIKDGFHERLAEAEERLHGLSRRREVAERRGRGLRLLRDLYSRRKEEQGQTMRGTCFEDRRSLVATRYG